MCPPPAEPIQPIGLLDGESYVERAQRVARIERRRPRHEDDPEHERRRGSGHDDDRNQLLRERWFGSESPLGDAGAYDDHGRPAPADDHDMERPHVDRTA